MCIYTRLRPAPTGELIREQYGTSILCIHVSYYQIRALHLRPRHKSLRARRFLVVARSYRKK